MTEFLAAQVTKQWAGEGGRSTYGAYRALELTPGHPATTVVGSGFGSAGEAQQAVQSVMPGTRLIWRRVDLAGGVESYEGIADV